MNSTGGIARFASRKKNTDSEKSDNNPNTDNNNETSTTSPNDEFTDFNTSFDFGEVDFGTTFGDFGSYLQGDDNPPDINVDFNFLEQDSVDKEANDSKVRRLLNHICIVNNFLIALLSRLKDLFLKRRIYRRTVVFHSLKVDRLLKRNKKYRIQLVFKNRHQMSPSSNRMVWPIHTKVQELPTMKKCDWQRPLLPLLVY